MEGALEAAFSGHRVYRSMLSAETFERSSDVRRGGDMVPEGYATRSDQGTAPSGWSIRKLSGNVAAFALLFGPGAAQAADCNRDCLIKLTDSYIAALVAHAPDKVPLAADAVIVENAMKLNGKQGLWQDATAIPTSFSIHVPDPQLQTAGWLGMMERGGQPVLVAIRLKLDDGRIVEAEHLTTTIRPENMSRLQAPRPGLLAQVPAAERKRHDDLIKLGVSYYDALDDNDGTLMPFAKDCQRHENGMITAGPSAGAGPNNAGSAPIARDCAGQLSSNVMAYIDRIENRRVFAADPVTGLVMGLSHFRHPMDFQPYEVTALDGSKLIYGKDRFPFEAFDLPAAHIFKIGADGLVHEIEAMGFMTTFQSQTGWE